MEAYDTVVEAINGLKKQGYIEDLNLRQNCLECSGREIKLFHDEFHIDKFFRFESGEPSLTFDHVCVNLQKPPTVCAWLLTARTSPLPPPS